MSGNIIINYCRSIITDEHIYVCSTLLWQRLQDNEDSELINWLPKTRCGKWYFSNCVCKHWVLVEYDCATRTLTQYDTIGTGIEVAQRLKVFI